MRRRCLIACGLAVALVVPVLIGTSCPAPSDPFYLSVTSSRLNVGTQVPDCVDGFVCLSVVNSACIIVEFSLYVHNGYDLQLDYCTWNPSIVVGGTPQRASEECPGYNLGEFQISRVDLFTPPAGLPTNLYPIQGSDIRTLAPRESVLVQIQDGDIKTFGIALGRVGTLPAAPEIRDAPRYRCTMVDLGTINVPRSPEDVPSGETFQYTIYDQSDCAVPGLARLAVRTGTSGSGTCPPVR
ncbi:MAG TPA: hypothetical protein PKY77_23435 [Phycisphaerae bacterium]|nr:hypothetical protein [Phycisphaerae bacterium]HRY71083.1 hypothetical protein [Phycisphaerae bacterium]HSA29742.1 hypothetical protein [Phycisphaerae bacterium]